jgi:hypothetical protein
MKEVTGCTHGWTPGKVARNAEDPAPCNQFNVSVMIAPTPEGPWGASTQVFLDSGNATSWYVPSGRQFSNPAPHVMDDGSIVCAFRADARTGGEHVSVASAASPLSAYVDSRAQAAVASHNGEDPYLWRDERGHWHLLMHNMGGGVGSHAFSRDAKAWTRSDVQPYTATVAFEDGTTKTMSRRERPQLVTDADGRPLFFTSGVQDAHDHTLTIQVRTEHDHESALRSA